MSIISNLDSTTETYVDSNAALTHLSETNIFLISGLVLCFFIIGTISVVFFCLYRKKSSKTEVIVKEVFLPMEEYQYDELDDDITTQTEMHQEEAGRIAAVDEDSNNDYQEDDYQNDDYQEDDYQDECYQEEERGTYYTYYDEEGNFDRTYSSS